MNLLDVEGLAKSYAGQPVLQDATLHVPAGSVVALLGSSGCGKTTLLRLIAGFEPADRGRITFGGRALQQPGLYIPAEQRRIGYVPQDGTLFPHLTVAGNIGFGLNRADRHGRRVAELLALTGLSALADRFPHQLSGGQQQRTALARALAPQPGLVLLDEPFNALDLDLRRTVCADVIATLRAEGATALLVTHDPQEAFASADTLAVMTGGRIGQYGDPATIYRTPASPEIARLTGPSILLPARCRNGYAETEFGALPAPGVADGPATAMIRPEQLRPAAPGTGIPARVTGMSFRGDHRLITAEAAGIPLSFRIEAGAALDPAGLHLAVHGPVVIFAAAG